MPRGNLAAAGTTHLASHPFEDKSMTLYGLTVGYRLVEFVVMDAILAAWA
ncbi:MAG: hypothetical protein HY660_13705 [Armatimonadetes bacterium]|nr:hypothetical protein [Armatimonadota bacterium]